MSKDEFINKFKNELTMLLSNYPKEETAEFIEQQAQEIGECYEWVIENKDPAKFIHSAAYNSFMSF